MTTFEKRVVTTGLVVAAFALASLAFTREAAAIPVFYQTGEDIFETGPLPAPLDKDPKLEGDKAGYKCQVFGLFWAYMAWWNCQPVAFHGDRYDDEGPVAAAVGKAYPPSAIQMGLWPGYGRWVVGAAIIGALVTQLMRRRKSD